MMKRIGWIALFCLLSFSTFLHAQNSRVEELTKKQEEKAKQLKPYVPNTAERWVLRVEGWGLLAPPLGPYPYLGSAYPGGGFAVGPGYRRWFGDNSIFDIHGAWSIENYRMADTSLLFPDLAHGFVTMGMEAKYIDANKVAFFGIGNDTSQDNKTTYTYKPFSAELIETVDLDWLKMGAGLQYLNVDTSPGASSPSVEQVFPPSTTPGFGEQLDWAVGHLFTAVDWRQSPGYTTRGGFYGVDYYFYNQKGSSDFNFQRFDAEIRQYFPILRANQIFVIRAVASFTYVKEPHEIPFYLLPRLGGGNELRGFVDYRFRDRNRLLMQAEYRWTPSKFMDMAIFYDTGKVAPNSSEINFQDLHDDYGIGVRFHTPTFVPLRFDVAHSVEGTRFIVSGGTSF
jgi:Omp85 superfamily domain